MLFEEQIARKPNLYPWTKGFIEAMQNGLWTDKEFNFKSDVNDFKVNLNDQEREVVVKALSAIGQIEIAVKTFWAKLGDNFRHPSITDLGYVMAYIETVHNEAYFRLLDELGLQSVFEENLKLDVIQGRVTYLRKYLHKYYKDSKKQYIYSLILFTLFIENVSLFSQFYVILWFGRFKNVLKDTNQQVMYTKSEELCHAQVGIKLVNVLRVEYPELFDKELEEKIIQETEEAFKAESKIIDWMLGDFSGPRMDARILKEYVKQRLNDSLNEIGYPAPFVIDQSAARDFEWMDEELLGNNFTDFFHKRSVNYSKNSSSFSENDLF